MPMGTGEKSKEKMGGTSVTEQFIANCKDTEIKQPQHKTLMDHKNGKKPMKGKKEM